MSRLIIFLALYLCIYGSAHLYLLIKARRAFYLEGLQYFLILSLFLFLILAPINARMLESQGQWLPGIMLAWIGFLWMGFVFIFICLSLPLDGYHLLAGSGQQLFNTDWTAIMLSRRQRIGLVAVVTCAVMGYGAVEAYHINTKKIILHSSKIAETSGPIRIVQISDLHIGPMFYPGRLIPIIDAIKKAQPHMLVSTGDLIDGRVPAPTAMLTALEGISAPLGKYGEVWEDLQTVAAKLGLEIPGR